MPAQAATGSLRISLFGTAELSRDGRRLPTFATAKAKLLFAFLALNRGRLYSRDSLMGILWGERPDPVARKNLRSDIWRVRRVIEPRVKDRGTLLLARKDALGLNGKADCWLDVEEFDRTTRKHEGVGAEDLASADAAELRHVVDLYRGDLLEEFYDEWCEFERQRLRTKLLEALERLMLFYGSREDWASALLYGRRVLELDPLREHIHRDVMRYLYFRGDRPAALVQFRQCAELLRQELDIGPMHETAALGCAIESETLAPASLRATHVASRIDGGRQGGEMAPVIGEIREALGEVRRASAHLLSSLNKLEARWQRDS